jgi:hypothetical protein
MATLSRIATVFTALALTRLDGRVLQFSGIPSIFSGGGLASALLSFDWSAAAVSSPQILLLAGILLLVVAMNGSGWIGELVAATRTAFS